MSVLVRIGRAKAILCGGKWTCANPRLEERLQSHLEIWIQKTGGPPIGNDDPDKFAADATSREMNFKVLLNSRPKRRLARSAYLAKRQIRLPF